MLRIARPALLSLASQATQQRSGWLQLLVVLSENEVLLFYKYDKPIQVIYICYLSWIVVVPLTEYPFGLIM